MTQRPNPVRWRFEIVYVSSDLRTPYYVRDTDGKETAPSSVPDKRRFKTKDAAKLFIENYEQSHNYARKGSMPKIKD